MDSLRLSRRAALKTFGAATLLGASSSYAVAGDHSSSKKKHKGAQGGLYYRHSVGKSEVYVLTDGNLAFPPHPTFGGDQATAEEVKDVLERNYQPTDMLTAHLNLTLIDDGKERTLIDVGYGERAHDGSGRLIESLQSAGFGPEDIDHIIISHAHPDHLFGLTKKNGEAMFPNADVLISKTEKEAWMKTEEELAAMKEAGEATAGMVRTINEILNGMKDRIRTVEAGDHIKPGVKTVDIHGHTPGHMGVLIESEADRVMVLADTANNEVLMTEKPDWPFGFDMDPKQTAISRRNIFDKVADQRIPCIGYHWSFPGLGYIGKSGDAYRYFPHTWSWG